ncbi:dGTPase [Pokkaliibacter sp. CJK22405]|uniref:dGTPase n=1 Tax=Pokkaliibacter sp. CJK22405 TaxID=3384615 RepID=UPI003984AEB5
MDAVMTFATKFSKRREWQAQDYGRHLVGDCGEEELLRQLESDRGRIINSAAVRRLQQKTQVFPLERNAAVRSRLTHSLEVQQNGRFIVRTLYKLAKRNWLQAMGLDLVERALETQVEMACLLHDVGNPPFGHFGEQAIQDWFRDQQEVLREALGSDELGQQMLRDLQSFEGNAQAIRLTHSILRLNLTYLQNAGLLKYVRCAAEPKPQADHPQAYLHKKPGYYLSEAPMVKKLWQTLHLEPGSRHPAAYIMEAADDISYCLADIEDAVEKGYFDIHQLKSYLLDAFARSGFDPQAPLIEQFGRESSFRDIVEAVEQKASREPIDQTGRFFIEMRVQLVHPLVSHAARQFIEHSGAILRGALDRALLEDGSVYTAIVSTLKQVAFERVFSHPEVETLELQGYRIIYGLLDLYKPLMTLSTEAFDALLNEGRGSPFLSRLIKRIPAKQRAAYQTAVAEADAQTRQQWAFYYRGRLLQDFVSGMTDQLAHDEFKTLSVSD